MPFARGDLPPKTGPDFELEQGGRSANRKVRSLARRQAPATIRRRNKGRGYRKETPLPFCPFFGLKRIQSDRHCLKSSDFLDELFDTIEEKNAFEMLFTGNRSGYRDVSPEASLSYLLADRFRQIDAGAILVYGPNKGVIAVSYISQDETRKDSSVDSKVLFEPE